jgi:predicted ABC-class ATPase
VQNFDMSPFFKYFPNNITTKAFSTQHASGSVSQAANIIEAVCGGSKLLLIDEDKSATNFMIRDKYMRRVVKKEPIIPLTDRVRELYTEKKISTILVIGGSSEYLGYADKIILMDDYITKEITDEVKNELRLYPSVSDESYADWMTARYLVPRKTTQPFLFFRSVSSENAKKIILDDFSADITLLTALVSESQLNALALMMEQLLTDKAADRAELNEIINEIADKMYTKDIGDCMLSFSFKLDRWFEAIRPIDIFCCVSRMRGLQFKNEAVR